MTMRYARPAAFTLEGAATNARHLRIQPGFINEDESLWVKVELLVEPLLTMLQESGAFLLQCMRGLFLYVKPRERSQELSADRPIFT